MASRSFVTHPLVARRLTVARVIDLNPRMRRITLTGLQLAEFTAAGHTLPPFTSTGFDDHVKLVFATGGDLATALPVQLAHTIDWPEAPHRQTRDYTVRRFDAAAGEVDLDIVRHGDGPAATWAEAATAGAELHLAGPKSSLVLPDRVDWVLLAGDETALPAIGRFLDERPLDVPVQVVVELRHPDARQELVTRPGDTVQWVVPPEGAPAVLADVVRELAWWPGEVFAWAAAESSALLPLRRWLSRDRAVPKSHVNVTGYWHEELRETAAEAPAVDADALLSPVPWFATRAAVRLGLLDAVAERPRPVAELAAALDLPTDVIRTLVGYLDSVGVLAGTAAGVELGPVGEQLLGDEHLRESVEDTLEARAVLALTELAPALRAGEPAFARRHGRTLLAELESDPSSYADRLAEAGSFAFVARGLLDVPSVQAADAVAVTGLGAGTVAETLSGRSPLVLVDAPVPLEVLRGTAGAEARTAAGFPAGGLAVAALALGYRTDAEAVALLARMAAATDRALLVEEVVGPGLHGPHAAEHRLVELAATGAGLRTQEHLTRLAASAGWSVATSTTLGWNVEVLELTR